MNTPIIPKTIEDLEKLSQFLFNSNVIKTKQENVHDTGLVAYYAIENKIPIIQALQKIYILKRSSWNKVLKKREYKYIMAAETELMLAQAYRTGQVEYFKEEIEGKIEEGTAKAICIIKRRDIDNEKEFIFSINDAKKAGLWGGLGPWTDYPLRMLKMRARGFALRDCFADAIGGLYTLEEARDIPDEDLNGIEKSSLPEKEASIKKTVKMIPAKPRTEQKVEIINNTYDSFSDLFGENYHIDEEGKFNMKSGVSFTAEEVKKMKDMSKEDKVSWYKARRESLGLS